MQERDKIQSNLDVFQPPAPQENTVDFWARMYPEIEREVIEEVISKYDDVPVRVVIDAVIKGDLMSIQHGSPRVDINLNRSSETELWSLVYLTAFLINELQSFSTVIKFSFLI